ncbi:hypothetical protein NG798_23210 [Ancylothrix sp. C2]|uniref:hypothetical protein n=1 Tax=Ancylothrix sp. D3o TaxID=2953691 RepID=UPI0021BB8B56|nr:hypothetical protein [Ancylothrix sp. D3o]MCT7952713.1 hypothetical protein [Ancylothrix sp. D3o]
MDIAKAKKSLTTLESWQMVLNVQELFNKVVKRVLILCTVCLLLCLATLQEAKALVQTPQNSIVSNSILIAFQVSEDTVSAVHKFEQAVRAIDPDGTLFVDISPAEYINGMVLITVANDWYYQPYQIRKQAAQSLWNSWAAIYSPENPDKARVKILDLKGNRIGGSSTLGGSLVDVDK